MQHTFTQEKTDRNYEVEISLSVADFDGDFDEASDAADNVIDLLHEQAEHEKKHVNVLSVEFVEFDSNNPGHAGAYYLVTYSGEQIEDAVEVRIEDD